VTAPLSTRTEVSYALKTLTVVALGYLAMRGVCAELAAVLPAGTRPVVDPLAYAALFILVFLPAIYLGPCALAGRWLRPAAGTLLLTMGTTLLCATLAEIVVDTAFMTAVGRPAWLYHLWPVHGGYTSRFGVLMWPMYGFFVCMLHEAMPHNRFLKPLDSLLGRALLVGADAMVLEVAANAFSLGFFGSWCFFYLQDDLHHFTSVEIFGPYVLVGWVGLQLLHGLAGLRHPALLGLLFWTSGLGLLMWVL
jgi:hypothetical protein